MPPAVLTKRLAIASAAVAGLTAFGASHASASRAPKVDQATLVSQAQAMLQQRSDAAAGVVRSGTPARVGNVRLTQERTAAYTRGLKALTGQHQVLREAGQQLTSARTQVTSPQTSQHGDGVTLDFVEYTTAVLKSTDGGASTTMEQQVPRRLVFSVAKDALRLNAEGLRTEPGSFAPFNDPTSVTTEESRAAVQALEPQRNAVAPTPADPKAANNTKVVAYAKKYWRHYNPAYRSFKGQGGDCANFASQSLGAGGWKPTSRRAASDVRGWWYAKNSQSNTWVRADLLPTFGARSKRATAVKNPYTLRPGDLLTADWNANQSANHIYIVTKVRKTGARELYLTAHSTDRLNYPYSLVVAQNPRALYGSFMI